MIIQNSNITNARVDCIINPANGLGVMHKGISKALYREGGPEVQNSAKEACFTHGLYKPGQAYMGSSGFLSQRGIKSICHAVTVYRHPEKTKLDNMKKAIISSINLIREYEYKSFAIPALGIEPRNISSEVCAFWTIETLWNFKNEFEISIIDINREFLDNCKKSYELKVKNEK